ncbi:Serine/threonine protein phosphatase 1 [Chelatococcus asaccharovorans]|nr:Serine/threonine protein phosphatase 1 [Chelatococcus asaccharovorans]CAH1675768.1 Serine/threonine protein phosphatase 1 [Chelatococcus asaccharovorans]
MIAPTDVSMMGITFVIADLHGRLDLLEAALTAVAERAPEGATVVFTGDYVDRGPQSRQVVTRLMAGPPPGWTWICLKGNHEDMMVGALTGTAAGQRWLDNGGLETLQSYGVERGGKPGGSVPAEHLAWMAELAPMHRDRYRIYVHAGVDSTLPIEAQDPETLIWMRYAPGVEDGHGDFHVVHGHTPHKDGPRHYRGRINLDTMAWRTGRLVVAVFDDDKPGGPVELIEIIAPGSKVRPGP